MDVGSVGIAAWTVSVFEINMDCLVLVSTTSQAPTIERDRRSAVGGVCIGYVICLGTVGGSAHRRENIDYRRRLTLRGLIMIRISLNVRIPEATALSSIFADRFLDAQVKAFSNGIGRCDLRFKKGVVGPGS